MACVGNFQQRLYRKGRLHFAFESAGDGSHASPGAQRGHRKPQIFAQRRPGERLAEQTSPLQLRHDEAYEILVGDRHV